MVTGVMRESTFVVGDIHGHRDELADALRERGLVDESDDWSGGTASLWFLGDFVDRGPHGVAAIDLVRKLQRQAPDAGGSVESLLGNHEILLLGMYRFGDTLLPSDSGPRSFARSWNLNGGQLTDQEELTDEHVAWLVSRPVVAHAADHLLLHSDSLEYLEWGDDTESINAAVRETLEGDDLTRWWEVWRRLTTRYAFRGTGGAQSARLLLDQLGGKRVVHGHSVIADQLAVQPWEIEQPCLYADDTVLGIDGGLFVGGPCLVVPLPWQPEG
jgi:hypothetical protein